jgi:hypothetical protein
MNRPTVGRLRLCVCGLMLATGCSHAMLPQESPAVVSAAPAKTTGGQNPAMRGPRAEFDVSAVRAQLLDIRSPYCQISTAHPDSSLPGAVPAPPGESSAVGVCVVQEQAGAAGQPAIKPE